MMIAGKTKDLKFSFYNIFVNIGRRIFIYNTLFGSLITVDKKISEIIKKERPNEITDKLLPKLQKTRIVLEKKFNEQKYVAEKIKESKGDNRIAHIFFITTLACNCKCTYCFEDKDVDGKSAKGDFEWFESFSEKFLKKSGSSNLLVDFFGGEPLLLWPKIKKVMIGLIKLHKSAGANIYFRFYTNGTILNDEMLRFFRSHKENIKDLQITLDGPKRVHDQRRPLKTGDSSFDAITKNISLLYENRIPVQLRVNIDNDNAPSIPRLLKELKKYRWHKMIPISFYPVQSLGESCRGYGHFFAVADISAALTKMWAIAVKEGLNINLKPFIKFIYCSSFNKNSIVVDYQRKAYKCAILHQQDHAMGEITADGELKIIDKKKLNQWLCRDSLSINGCKKCKLLPTCASGCGGSAFNKFGTWNINNCSGNKQIFMERLKIYIKQKHLLSNSA